MTGGLWQCRHEPVATKHLHVAEAARRGVQAARYAGAGLAGPRTILEGVQGFFAAVARDGDAEAVVAEGPWRVHEVSFKPGLRAVTRIRRLMRRWRCAGAWKARCVPSRSRPMAMR